MKAEYENVFEATTKELKMIPATFQYGKDMSASIQGLHDRIQVETQNKCKSKYSPSEIKKMEGALHSLKGEVGESVVRSGFERLWHDKQGVMFHSFHPETLLSPLTNRAKSQRLSRTDLNYSDLELKLANILNIDLREIQTETIKFLNSIKSTNGSCVKGFSAQLLESEIAKLKDMNRKRRQIIQDSIKQSSKKLNKKDFTFDEAEKIISIANLHHIMRPDGEMDFLGLLVSEKLVFNFEVKYQITDSTTPPTKLLNDACRQLETNEGYLSRVFGPLFSDGWRLIKVPIIIQQNSFGSLDPTTYCEHCSKYIITSGSLSDLPGWLKKSQLETNSNQLGQQILSRIKSTKKTKHTPQYLDQEEVEFLRFFELITSSISTSSRISAWNWVQGSNQHLPVAAGHTPIQPSSTVGKGKFGFQKGKMSQNGPSSTSSVSAPDTISLEEALYKYHDAQKVLFYSRLQVSLLNCSLHLHTILTGDYGVGK